ncbi:hypothetical protein CAY59_07765 [Vibrio campbellii]|uniref:GIY-YIG nuclease family protein n=1 Tax=Vibrio campbellii TaxID=680 RepID=UPI000A2F95CD|nr:GIY-YIG nuclease family protein [Vibrio campbellii]ARR44242.1 hypothetical protein CAY59_07765 [Vibrio campbellii]
MSKKKLTEYLLLENRKLFFSSIGCICNGPVTKKAIELIIQEQCKALSELEEFTSRASSYLDGKVIHSASVTKPIKDLILKKVDRKDLKEKYNFDDGLVEYVSKLYDGNRLHLPEGDKANIKLDCGEFSIYQFLINDIDSVSFSGASSSELYFDHINQSVIGSMNSTSTLSKGFRDILLYRENSDYLKDQKFMMYLNLPDKNLSAKEVIERVEFLDAIEFCDKLPCFFDRLNSAFILDEIYKSKSLDKGVSLYVEKKYGFKFFTNEERKNAFYEIKNLVVSFLNSQNSEYKKNQKESTEQSVGYLYIGLKPNNIIKIGRTKDRQRREREHKSTTNGYNILHEVETFNHEKCENILKDIFCLHFEPTDKYVNRTSMKNSGKAEEFYLKEASVNDAKRLFYSTIGVFPLTGD